MLTTTYEEEMAVEVETIPPWPTLIQEMYRMFLDVY